MSDADRERRLLGNIYASEYRMTNQASLEMEQTQVRYLPSTCIAFK